LNDTSEERVAYHKERLIREEKFREEYMENLGKIGVMIEDIYKEEQDIEGAFYNG
jgi:hypothetical protein